MPVYDTGAARTKVAMAYQAIYFLDIELEDTPITLSLVGNVQKEAYVCAVELRI